jgi:hypothetical protein
MHCDSRSLAPARRISTRVGPTHGAHDSQARCTCACAGLRSVPHSNQMRRSSVAIESPRAACARFLAWPAGVRPRSNCGRPRGDDSLRPRAARFGLIDRRSLGVVGPTLATRVANGLGRRPKRGGGGRALNREAQHARPEHDQRDAQGHQRGSVVPDRREFVADIWPMESQRERSCSSSRTRPHGHRGTPPTPGRPPGAPAHGVVSRIGAWQRSRTRRSAAPLTRDRRHARKSTGRARFLTLLDGVLDLVALLGGEDGA